MPLSERTKKLRKKKYMKAYWARKKKSAKMKAHWAECKRKGIAFGKWNPGVDQKDYRPETEGLNKIEQMFGEGKQFKDLTPEQRTQYYRAIDKRYTKKLKTPKAEGCGCGPKLDGAPRQIIGVMGIEALIGVTLKRMIEGIVEAKLAAFAMPSAPLTQRGVSDKRVKYPETLTMTAAQKKEFYQKRYLAKKRTLPTWTPA